MRSAIGFFLIAVLAFAAATTFIFPEVRNALWKMSGLSPVKTGVPAVCLAVVGTLLVCATLLNNKHDIAPKK